ncbi:MAG TPA: DUF2239 family protein [Thermoanaerobaculia bacterium]|jgi:hypothetical protein|nr:DUF2239 family protein [Thermoanaerobaculia bacterium]
MSPKPLTSCTAFLGTERIASGDLRLVAEEAKTRIDRGDLSPLLIFDDVTSQPVELDLRGTLADVLTRLPVAAETQEGPAEESAEARSPGRPKLGVIAREVTLLPRHWEWLGTQPGGASVTLRKLVEAARKSHTEEDRLRQRREAAYRFMTAMGGNEAGFEEAIRALFAGQREPFEQSLESWPPDVREHAQSLAGEAFPAAE